MSKPLLSPSILAADFGRLTEEIGEVKKYAHSIHVDVMDGHFVPNLTIGPVVVNSLKREKQIDLPLNVHLMISEPGRYGPQFELEEDDLLIFHHETPARSEQLIEQLSAERVGLGMTQKPKEDPSNLFPYLSELEEVLVMSVKPGFGGQEFMPEALDTIAALREEIDGRELDTKIAVDGGINEDTAGAAYAAGADVLVAGSAVFGASDRPAALRRLEKTALEGG